MDFWNLPANVYDYIQDIVTFSIKHHVPYKVMCDCKMTLTFLFNCQISHDLRQ